MFFKSLAFGVYIMEAVFRASDLVKIAGLTLWFEGACLTQRQSYVIAEIESKRKEKCFISRSRMGFGCECRRVELYLAD